MPREVPAHPRGINGLGSGLRPHVQKVTSVRDAAAPGDDGPAPQGPENRILMIDLLLKLAGGADPRGARALAVDLESSATAVRDALTTMRLWGLIAPRDEPSDSPLLSAGEQFLARDGRVPHDTLAFLPTHVDDLNAREALRRAGVVLVDEFVDALRYDRLVEHACEVVPPAFIPAVDIDLSGRLLAATSALMVRLAQGEPAGCVAEEIIAVRLIERAEVLLEENGRLSAVDTERAVAHLGDVFDLFQDDDVLMMFEMSDPSDAAVAEHGPLYREMGVADQRVEAWFDPFTWSTATGHLSAEDERWP